MNHEMRRKDRALTREENEGILQNGEYGVMATVDADGTPYAVPLSYAYDGEKLYFHGTIEGGRKHSNMVDRGKGQFVVVGETRVMPEKFGTIYHSVMVEGSVRLVEDEAEKKAGLMKLIHKYSHAFEAEGAQYVDRAVGKAAVYEMTIESISGKARKK